MTLPKSNRGLTLSLGVLVLIHFSTCLTDVVVTVAANTVVGNRNNTNSTDHLLDEFFESDPKSISSLNESGNENEVLLTENNNGKEIKLELKSTGRDTGIKLGNDNKGRRTWRDIEGLFSSKSVPGNSNVKEILSRKSLHTLTESHEHAVINFYSSFCGHCQHYASIWRRIAKTIYEANPQVVIGAVNCESFRNLCTSYKIDDVPVIMYFTGTVRPGTGKVISDSSYEGVMSFVRSNSIIKSNDINGSDETDSYTDSNTPKSLGFPDIETRTSPQEIKVKNHLKLDPGYTDGDHGDNRMDDSNDNDGDVVDGELGENNKKSNEYETFDKETTEYETALPPNHNILKLQLLNDVSIAVRFGLENDVFLGRDELTGDALKALLEWINLLTASFPGDNERLLLTILQRKILHLESIKQNPARISSKDWDTLLQDWPFAHENKIWKACPVRKVNKPNGIKKDCVRGGYSCALWLLFHTLSVSSITGGVSPEETAVAIHGFIKHFFNCKECRNNFIRNNPDPVSMLITKRFHVNSKNHALLLWLWNEHNTVSMRLLREHPSESRNVFPTRYHCPSCRNRNKNKPTRADVSFSLSFFPKVKTLELPENKRSWKLENIVRFMKAAYCFDDSVLSCPQHHDTPSVASDSGSILLFLLLVFCGILFAGLKLLGEKLNKKVH